MQSGRAEAGGSHEIGSSPAAELPEGEVTSPGLMARPAEYGIHDNIVALIRAVHVRFG